MGRRVLLISRKLKAIDDFKGGMSVGAVAKKYKSGKNQVRRWVGQEDELREKYAKNKKARTVHSGG